MAIAASGTWEVRPGSGVDTNGGGYIPGASGTDFSQQNSAQVTYTDLVIGATTTQLTSAGNPFGSSAVGNFIQITSGSGFTVGIYQVVSVSSGIATMDRSTGTAASTGGHGNLGGALATLDPVNTRTVGSTTQGTNGNTIYFKNTGTITVTSTRLNFDLGTYTLIGYGTTRGDNVQSTITTATNSTFLFEAGNGGFFWNFQNIKMTSTASTKAAAIEDGNSIYYLLCQNCTFDGPKYALETTVTTHHVTFANCEIKNCSSHGVNSAGTVNINFVGCYIHGNTGDGVQLNGTGNGGISGSARFMNCVIKSNGTIGINNVLGGGGNAAIDVLVNSCAVINNGGDGINTNGTGSNFGQMLGLYNTIIDSNGGIGVHCSGSLAGGMNIAYGACNAFGSGSTANVGGDRSNFPVLPGDITLTADAFTNRSGSDFILNTTSGGGPLCKAAGYPGALLVGGTGFVDIGPLQSSGSTTVNTIVVSPTYTRFVVEEL